MSRRCSYLSRALAGLAASALGCTVLVERELEGKEADTREVGGPDGGGDAAPAHSGGSADTGVPSGDAASSDQLPDADPGPADAATESIGASAPDGGPDSDAGPAPVATGVKLCVGGNHGCGLRANGELACWGSDNQGQRSLPTDRTYREVACGDAHTCTIDTHGALSCAGRNADGQRASAPGPFTQVTAGDAHTCVLDHAGRPTCFGRDADGQASPPDVALRAVAAGADFTCGIGRDDRTLRCWGRNADAYMAAAAGEKLLSLSAGHSYICAVTERSAPRCWGEQHFQAPALGAASQVAAGEHSACALLTDGSVRCWPELIDEAIPHERGPFALIAVGGSGRCFMPPGGPVLCESSVGSAIATGLSGFPR